MSFHFTVVKQCKIMVTVIILIVTENVLISFQLTNKTYSNIASNIIRYKTFVSKHTRRHYAFQLIMAPDWNYENALQKKGEYVVINEIHIYYNLFMKSTKTDEKKSFAMNDRIGFLLMSKLWNSILEINLKLS